MMKIQLNNPTSVLSASVLIAIALFGAGCASIVHGGSRTVTVNTTPAGAKATITKASTGESVHSGTTPFTVALDPKKGFFKGQSYVVKFELPGYKSTEVSIRSELSGWYFGNIIFGGLIGMLIVDPATGSMWNLSPEKIGHTLTSEQVSLIKNGNGFVVALVSQIGESERAQMVRIN